MAHPLECDVLGELGWPGPKRDRVDGFRDRNPKFVKCRRRRSNHRRSHVRYQRRETVVVERFPRLVKEVCPSFVVDRCGRYAGLDQFDPPTAYDPVVHRSRDGQSPAIVMGDAKTHATDSVIRSAHDRCR
jgi:hypothetical protein